MQEPRRLLVVVGFADPLLLSALRTEGFEVHAIMSTHVLPQLALCAEGVIFYHLQPQKAKEAQASLNKSWVGTPVIPVFPEEPNFNALRRQLRLLRL